MDYIYYGRAYYCAQELVYSVSRVPNYEFFAKFTYLIGYDRARVAMEYLRHADNSFLSCLHAICFILFLLKNMLYYAENSDSISIGGFFVFCLLFTFLFSLNFLLLTLFFVRGACSWISKNR